MKIEYSYRANSVNTINTGIYKNNTIQFKDNLNNIKDSNTMSQSETFAINDKEFYDHFKAIKHPAIESIEYGSKEWDKFKEGRAIFPPLNAPVEVRRAWQEVEDSIPKDDQKAQEEFFMQKCILEIKASMPEKFGLGANFQLNTIQDYETLFNKDIMDNIGLKETLKDGIYNKFIQMDKQFQKSLDKYQVLL